MESDPNIATLNLYLFNNQHVIYCKQPEKWSI